MNKISVFNRIKTNHKYDRETCEKSPSIAHKKHLLSALRKTFGLNAN